MSHTKRPVTSTFVRTGMFVSLIFVLFGCGTMATSDNADLETTEEMKPETTIATSIEETTSSALSKDGVYFPRIYSNVSYMADIHGRLFLDDMGCIRLEESDDGPTMLIWPASFDLRVKGEDIRVLDQRGRTVGRVGERVDLGGGGIDLDNDRGIPGLF